MPRMEASLSLSSKQGASTSWTTVTSARSLMYAMQISYETLCSDKGVQYVFESGDASPDLSMVNGLIDWKFLTTPQPSLLNRTIHYVRGKCLGGSSARNYMVYNRGTVDAFAQWASDVGDIAWDWDGVYPYYRKSPHYTPANTHLRAANASIGTVNESPSFARSGGPLHVSYPNLAQPWASFWPSAFEEVGVPLLSHAAHPRLHFFGKLLRLLILWFMRTLWPRASCLMLTRQRPASQLRSAVYISRLMPLEK